jgi:hypothetical protein
MDDPAIRQAFADAMTRSNPNAAAGTGLKKEVGGVIWRMADGSLRATEVPDPNATECHYDFVDSMFTRRPDSLAVAIASYHTHPTDDGKPIYGCKPTRRGTPQAQRLGDGLPVPLAAPNDSAAGGGSPGDWASTVSGQPAYTILKNGRVYRLDPNVPPADRGKNRNRWNLKDPTTGCPTKILP